MPSHTYALRPGDAKRLEVSWKGFWKDIRIKLDGAEIGSIPGKAALEAGADFALPGGGGALRVQLVTGMAAELRVTLDGAPLPGSASDPATRVRTAAGVLYFIAGLSVVVGLAAELFHVAFLEQLGIGWTSVAAGAVLAVLGFFTSRGSRVALVLGIALIILDGVAQIAVAVSTLGQGTPPVGPIVMRVLFLLPLFRAYGAMGELQRDKVRPVPPHGHERLPVR